MNNISQLWLATDTRMLKLDVYDAVMYTDHNRPFFLTVLKMENSNSKFKLFIHP